MEKSKFANKLTENQKLEIVEKYKTGKYNCASLGREYGIVRGVVNKILKNRNIKVNNDRSSLRREYSLNQHYFDKIDTEGKAYFLGLMYADGCNYEPASSIIIALAEKDKHILEKFKQEIQSTKPLEFTNKNDKNPNHQNVWRFTETSKHMSNKLKELGCMQAKTFLIEFPTAAQVPEYLINHFIRGYFDGDGTIGFYHTNEGVRGRFSFAGTEKFCISVKEIINNKLNIYSKVANVKDKTIKVLNISGRQQIIKVMDWLYQESTIYLDRKHKVYLKMKNYIPLLKELNLKEYINRRFYQI